MATINGTCELLISRDTLHKAPSQTSLKQTRTHTKYDSDPCTDPYFVKHKTTRSFSFQPTKRQSLQRPWTNVVKAGRMQPIPVQLSTQCSKMIARALLESFQGAGASARAPSLCPLKTHICMYTCMPNTYTHTYIPTCLLTYLPTYLLTYLLTCVHT